MFCVYKTDPDWITSIKELGADVQVNFWRRGKNELKLPFGSWFYFNERGTSEIVGRGVLVGYEVLTIDQAWKAYGFGNGVDSLVELRQRARAILGLEIENPEIGCILLSELEFLPVGLGFKITSEDYSPYIVGPKYFKDHELMDLRQCFSVPEPNFRIEESGVETVTEGGELFSYRRGYERNPEARRRCLEFCGFRCQVCELLLEEAYGPAAKQLVHVHHLSPISGRRVEYELDPTKDLVPLCPNCRAVAHRRAPPYSVEELREMRSSRSI